MKNIYQLYLHIFKQEFLLLTLCFVIAFFLRFYLLPQHLFFGPEQGKDFLVIKDIVVNHNPTLIGAKTDIEGVFHGPLYYYISAIPFFITGGNPVAVAGFLCFLQSITTFLIFILGKDLWNRRIGWLAAILFTFSYSAIVYSRWVSSQPLAIPCSAILFWLFYRYLQGKDVYLIFSAVALGLLVQIQFLNLVFFFAIFFTIFFFTRRRLIKTKRIILISSMIVLILLSMGNFVLFDLRHDFLITKSIVRLVNGDSGFYSSYIETFWNLWHSLSFFFSQNIFPFFTHGIVLLLFLFLFGMYVYQTSRKQIKGFPLAILLVWFFVPLVLLVGLRHGVLLHFLIPLTIPILLLVALIIDWLWQKHRLLGLTVLVIIVVSNILAYQRNIPRNENIFFQENQRHLYLSDQIKTIDRIYTEAHGIAFSFQAYTIPYWWQDGWTYLFWFYGQEKYGYAPILEKAGLLFVIIQDDPNNTSFQQNWLKNTVATWGEKVSEFRYGILRIEKLQIKL